MAVICWRNLEGAKSVSHVGEHGEDGEIEVRDSMKRRAEVPGDLQSWQQVAGDGLGVEDLHQVGGLEGDADIVGVVVAKRGRRRCQEKTPRPW